MKYLALIALFSFVILPAHVHAQDWCLRRVGFSYHLLTKACIALRVAKDRGIFEECGLDVNLVVIRSGNISISALIIRGIDILSSPAPTAVPAAKTSTRSSIVETATKNPVTQYLLKQGRFYG